MSAAPQVSMRSQTEEQLQTSGAAQGRRADSGGNNNETDSLLPRTTVDGDARDYRANASGLLIWIAPALLAGIIVKAFDIAFLATNYPRLASDLQHFKDAPWIMLTASICSAVFVPLVSKILHYSYLLHAFGMKRMMLVAYSAFAIASTLCAISTSFWQLLCSRFALGLGSSGITLLSMISINEIVGIQQLAIWESFVTCVEMGTSMIAGPFGAWMLRRFSWHSVFLLESALTVVGIGLVLFSFAVISSRPEYSHSPLLEKGHSRMPRIDLEGWVLLLLAVAIPLVAVTLGDNFLDWAHPIEITLLICSPLFISFFVLFEAKVARVPIVNMQPVFEAKYLRVLFQVFGVIMILNSIVFIIPSYAQIRAFEKPAFEDWALTCVFLGFPVGAILGGYLIKTDALPVQRIMLANAVILECFCLLYVTRVIKPELVQYSPFLVGFGICTGAWQSCLLYATLSSTQKQWWPQTLALYYLVETFGADLGIALMSTIARSVVKPSVRAALGNSETTEKIIADALRDLQTISLLEDHPRAKVLGAFEYAMHTTFILPCVVAVGVVILAAGTNFGLHPSSYEPLHHTGPDEEST